MTFRVDLHRTAAKELKRLPAEAREALLVLETNPEAGETLTGALSGLRSHHFSLKGSGQYRAIYEFDGATCFVRIIATRENIYKEIERRI